MDSGGSSHLSDSLGRSGGGSICSDASETNGGSVVEEKDRCDVLVDTKLQDVEQCGFYLETSNVPGEGTPVTLERVDKRIVVLDSRRRTVGTIPANFDPALGPCLLQGSCYAGTVVHSSLGPPIIVAVNIGLKK